jgi:glycerophosphoryl diester phosphodiesterase
MRRFIPPIAHRGLHDERHGIIENTASAFRAAILGGYGIETDIQAAAGGEPVIFHDERLERLTYGAGEVKDFTPAQLAAIPMRGTGDRIMPLAAFLALAGGRVPLFLEIKSLNRTDRTVERRIAEELAAYSGPVTVMSFDPGSLAAMRRHAPHIPRGLASMRFWKRRAAPMSPAARFRLTHMLDFAEAKPDFLTYKISDLPAMATALRKRFPDLPVIAWTVRSPEDRRKALAFADGMIFEGFRPPPREMGRRAAQR